MEVIVDIVGCMDGLASSVGNVRNMGSLGFRLLFGLLGMGGVAVDCLGNVAVHLVALLLELVVQLVALGLEHRLFHLVSRLHGLLLCVQVSHHQGVDVLLLVAMAVLVGVIKVVVVPMVLLVEVVEVEVVSMSVLVAFAVPSQQHALVLVVVLGSAVAVDLVDGHHLFGRGGLGGRDTKGGRMGLDKLELTGRLRIATVL